MQEFAGAVADGDEFMPGKSFNITGLCFPNENYMVNIEGRLKEIKKLVKKSRKE